MDIVFLPATDPGDETCVVMPDRIEAYPDASIHHIHYPTMVWYNQSVCKKAVKQIQALGLESIILVGFSKSGLGAWNIARSIPDRIAGTIIFDAPVACDNLPPWGTDAFYANDAAWRKDLPVGTIQAFAEAMPRAHQLVLISGANFHEEMCMLSQALSKSGVLHVFLPHPNMEHHWNSGWIEEGLNKLLEPSVLGSACRRL